MGGVVERGLFRVLLSVFLVFGCGFCFGFYASLLWEAKTYRQTRFAHGTWKWRLTWENIQVLFFEDPRPEEQLPPQLRAIMSQNRDCTSSFLFEPTAWRAAGRHAISTCFPNLPVYVESSNHNLRV